jgi:ankyrin repeat protein
VIAGHGNLEQVKTLLAQTPDLLEVSHFWSPTDPENALVAAAHVGNREIAHYLLEQGAKLTPGAAAMLGRLPELEAMLSKDSTLADSVCVHGIRMLFHGALSGQVAVMDLLVKHGAKGDFEHALHGAVYGESVEVVKWVLENGVTDVNTLNFQQKTPLAYAVENGLTEIAALLKSHNAV